jgi:pyruvate/2-oxoglutarate dehydrogenase complex dihydrolipoamide acyltransferase (E2) component
VEASDPFSVVARESRTIRSVAVKVGDEILQDGVIYYLDETESLELKQAETELADMELAYMKALFDGQTSSNVINKVEDDDMYTFEQFKNIVTGINNSITGAENDVDAKKKVVEEKQRRMVSLGVQSGDQVALKDQLLLNVEGSSRYVLEVISGILRHYQEVPLASEEAAMEEARTKTILKMLYETDKISEGQFEASSGAYEGVWDGHQRHLKNLNDAIKIAENELIIAMNELRDAEDRLEKITERHTDTVGDVQAEISFANQLELIEAKKREIERLKEKSIGPAITSPVAGIVTSLSHVAGETVQMDSTVAIIQVAGKGFTVSFGVSNEQASRVQVGDTGDIQSGWWWSSDTVLILTSIKPHPDNPGQQKLLTFSVSGTEVQDGQQLNISVGQRSANYDMTVPNSAIREDSNGSFILIVETRTTPLNNRYIATRVDVEILAQDETNTAISAATYAYQYVITTATKPVAAGDQIRLTN